MPQGSKMKVKASLPPRVKGKVEKQRDKALLGKKHAPMKSKKKFHDKKKKKSLNANNFNEMIEEELRARVTKTSKPYLPKNKKGSVIVSKPKISFKGNKKK